MVIANLIEALDGECQMTLAVVEIRSPECLENKPRAIYGVLHVTDPRELTLTHGISLANDIPCSTTIRPAR